MSASGPNSSGPAVPVPLALLRVLIVEDSELDARVLVSLLRQGGWSVTFRRVETREAMRQALESEKWDLVLSDHSLPAFSAPEALQLLQETGLDLPFLIVSGGIEEGVAVAAMKAGAHDFLMKGALGRLVPAVQRELREAQIRAARRESELRYRSVWENSTDAVLLIDLGGVIRFANPAVGRVFGREPEAVVGQPLDLLQPAGVPAGDWWGRARDDRQRVMESEVARPDGTPAVVEIAFTGMRMGAQEWVVAFARDITERLRAEAEIRRSRAEFAAARDIQQQLLPKAPPPLAGFDMAGASHPAAAAGGDYFDYLTLADGGLGVAVADVSGHGLASAMLMVEARAHLRLLAREGASPAGILSAANPALAEDLGRERFITLALVAIDPSNLRLTYASAGHMPVFILASDGTVRKVLRRTGPPLGRDPGQRYVEGEAVQLEAGDLILLLTDGIDEATNPEETDCFGLDRAVAVVGEHRGADAAEIVRRLVESVKAFAGSRPPDDDVTAVVIKVLASPVPGAGAAP